MDIVKIVNPKFKFALTHQAKNIDAVLDGIHITGKDFLPKRANETDVAYDVRASQKTIIKPGSYAKIPLGIIALIPEGWWLSLHPRSGCFVKKHIHNLYGVIDQDFSHELMFCCQYIPDAGELQHGSGEIVIECCERVGQLIPIQRVDMDIEECTEEDIKEEMKRRNSTRNGGFSSTGRV